MPRVLGLTGGIATGKSTVVSIFRALGFPVVDGDEIARLIVEPGKPALAAIADHFGSAVLFENGELNRKKLGEMIFSNPPKREALDQLLDPYLREAILQQVAEKKQEAPLVIVDIPLLFERKYESVVDQVAVIYVPESVQLARLMARDQLSENEAWARIRSQLPIDRKKEQAAVVFDNQGSVDATKKQVMDWLKQEQFIS